MIKHIKDIVQGKAEIKDRRSSKWQSLRKEYLKNQPICAACGGSKSLEVHHIKPFNKNPEFELDKNNLITLCESKNNGVNCHLLFGHLGNYKTINANVIEDARIWNSKIKNRHLK